MEKALIIEPHFDDAWINLGGYILLHPECEFFILTISSHPSNYNNGTDILKGILGNISGNFLGYKSLGFDDPTIHAMENKYNTLDQEKIFLKMNELESFAIIKNEIKNYASDFENIFWPLGMKHPQHILMDKMNPFKKCFYYREYPYFFYKDQEKVRENLVEKKEEVIVDISTVIGNKMSIINHAYSKQKFILDLNVDNVTLKELNTEVFWEEVAGSSKAVFK